MCTCNVNNDSTEVVYKLYEQDERLETTEWHIWDAVHK